MICRVGDRRFEGRAVAIERDLDPERVARAVREGAAKTGGPAIEVEAPAAGPLHDRVGCIHGDIALRPRTALAAAGRSLGWTTAVDEELEEVRNALGELDAGRVPHDDAARRRVAEARSDVEALRERVAAVRGRVEAADDPDDAAAELEAAIRSLSEVETRVAAARERRGETREVAREARDRLEERLRLVDRRDNLERRARQALVDRARERYERALAAVPGVHEAADPFDAPADAMALAIARVGDLAAPVVLAVDRFPDAERAAAWLEAPVIHLEP